MHVLGLSRRSPQNVLVVHRSITIDLMSIFDLYYHLLKLISSFLIMKGFINVTLQNNARAIGDDPRNFEPRSSDEDNTLASTSLSKLPHHVNLSKTPLYCPSSEAPGTRLDSASPELTTTDTLDITFREDPVSCERSSPKKKAI
ncbi:hypothetical protein TNCV_3693071 [Trichonephila clavipes]|nr:hypothetical protein TNCV_3693071 [Trichonephila clavipes]